MPALLCLALHKYLCVADEIFSSRIRIFGVENYKLKITNYK